MKVIFGYNDTNGHPTVGNTEDIESWLNVDNGGAWSGLAIIAGLVSGFGLIANSASGSQKCYRLTYDGIHNQYFRPISGGYAMGQGAVSTCSGCNACQSIFDDDLNTTGCNCLGSGTCSLSTDILT